MTLKLQSVGNLRYVFRRTPENVNKFDSLHLNSMLDSSAPRNCYGWRIEGKLYFTVKIPKELIFQGYSGR